MILSEVVNSVAIDVVVAIVVVAVVDAAIVDAAIVDAAIIVGDASVVVVDVVEVNVAGLSSSRSPLCPSPTMDRGSGKMARNKGMERMSFCEDRGAVLSHF